MRIRIVQQPHGTVDGVSLNRFTKGCVYDVGTSLASYLLASGWAEPLSDEAPGLVLPIDHPITETLASKSAAPMNGHTNHKTRRSKRR